MTNWIENQIPLSNKQVLIGSKCEIIESQPPKPTSKTGLYNLVVKVDGELMYEIVVTRTDLDDIKKLFPKPFSFKEDEKNPVWANVVEWHERKQ